MLQPKIAVVDYGMGNLRSVMNALREVGADAELVAQPEQLEGHAGIIIPGVGAFEQAIAALHRTGMAEALNHQRQAGRPLLGICLGMQLMCNSSEEDGQHQGLGWVDAEVKAIPVAPGIKVPHIGWNDLSFPRAHFLVDDLPPTPDVYFVHSYRVECAHPEDVVATCNYGVPFCAIFAHDNVMGIQFHPEKSQQVGLRILTNFARSL